MSINGMTIHPITPDRLFRCWLSAAKSALCQLCRVGARVTIRGMHATDPVIQSASTVPIDDLVRAINAAYIDYYVPIHLTHDSLQRLVDRESVRLSASAVALYKGKIAGMGLFGIRGTRGWITGIGVVPRMRRRGIARKIMEWLIAEAQNMRLGSVQLEVITQNENALHLYESLGFARLRKLLVLTWMQGQVPIPAPESDLPWSIRQESPDGLIEAMQPLITVPRPWQRARQTIESQVSRIQGLAARTKDGMLAGACIYRIEGEQIGLLDLAAAEPAAADNLLRFLLSDSRAFHASYVNVPDDDPLLHVLLDRGFQEALSQYEMILPLSPETAQ